MEWPAQSPDINPFKNLWSDIKNTASEAKPQNSQQLWNAFHSYWAEIPISRCQTLVATQLTKTMVMQLNISSVI